MGRGADVAEAPRRGKDVAGFSVFVPDEKTRFDEEYQRSLLEKVARARLGRSDVTITLISCARCNHKVEEHSPSCLACGCAFYVGTSSATDMKGNILIQSDNPPDGDALDRAIAMEGFLRHELAHELYTDPATFALFKKEYERLLSQGEGLKGAQLHRIFNALEDGMIETRSMAHDPGFYASIEMMNELAPRIPESFTVQKDLTIPLPGQAIKDIDGRKLEDVVDEINPLTGKEEKMLCIPQGTKLPIWTDTPFNQMMQMDAALIAESVPGFSPGKLHPNVQAALDECKPHIDAAVCGNTADTLERAYKIYDILQKYRLLAPDPVAQESQDEIKENVSGPQEPNIPENTENRSQGQDPLGPSASEGDMSSSMSEDLQKELERQFSEDKLDTRGESSQSSSEASVRSSGEESGQSTEGASSEESGQSTKGASSEESGQSTEGASSEEAGQSTKGASSEESGQSTKGASSEESGQSAEGESRKTPALSPGGDSQITGPGGTSPEEKVGRQDAAGGDLDDISADSQQMESQDIIKETFRKQEGSDQEISKDPLNPGQDLGGEEAKTPAEGEQGGGKEGGFGGEVYDPTQPLSRDFRKEAEKRSQERRSRARENISKRKEEMQSEARARDRVSQRKTQRRINQGDVGVGDWSMPEEYNTPVSQEDLEARSESYGLNDIDREAERQLQRQGRRVGRRIRKIKEKAEKAKTHQKSGRLDTSSNSLRRAATYDRRVFVNDQESKEMDLYIDVCLDRSGSIGSSAAQEQYEAAKVISFAAEEAKIPLGIFGYSGQDGRFGTQIAEYKKPNSKSDKALGSIREPGSMGTPTAQGIQFARARARRVKEKQKYLIVVTDGAANNLSDARRQVEEAKQDGIRVIGLGVGLDSTNPEDNYYMQETFGDEQWNIVSSFHEVGDIVIDLIEKAAESLKVSGRRKKRRRSAG